MPLPEPSELHAIAARYRAIDEMAESIADYIDLDDNAKVAIDLVLKGFGGAIIGDDLPLIIDRARRIRADFGVGEIASSFSLRLVGDRSDARRSAVAALTG
jgi:hypothetical protein